MLLGKELINVFRPGVLILFDCGAGEMMKAALSQRVVSVGIAPNKTHKDMLIGILRKFVEGVSLVNLSEGCPTKPLALIKFEAAHPDNEDVKRSATNTRPGPTASSVIRADPASPRANQTPSTPIGSIVGSPQTPRTPQTPRPPVPKVHGLTSPVIIPAPTGSATGSASSTQPPPPPATAGVLAFGTTVL